MFWLLFLMQISPSQDYVVPPEVLGASATPVANHGLVKDGAIYVATGGKICKFDFSGQEVVCYTKKGRGPRELMAGKGVVAFGEGLLVFDPVQQKVLLLSTDLEYEKHYMLQSDGFPRFFYMVATKEQLYGISWPIKGASGYKISFYRVNLERGRVEKLADLSFGGEEVMAIGELVAPGQVAVVPWKCRFEETIVHIWDEGKGESKSYSFETPFHLEDHEDYSWVHSGKAGPPMVNAAVMTDRHLYVQMDHTAGKPFEFGKTPLFLATMRIDVKTGKSMLIEEMGTTTMFLANGPTEDRIGSDQNEGLVLIDVE